MCLHLSNNCPTFQAASPMLYPKEQVDPLTLQDSSFLYIKSSVNKYPVSILSQLPLAWRRKLFSALPPLRLYELEKTSIADRTKTDEIWKKLRELKGGNWALCLMDRRSKKLCLQSSPFLLMWTKSPTLTDLVLLSRSFLTPAIQ